MLKEVRDFINSPERSAAFMVLAGAFLISFSGVYVKLAHVSPTVAGFYRLFFGGVILAVIVLVKRERLWKNFFNFFLCVMCALFFTLDLFFWHKSIHYIGPGLATIIPNFQVFILAFFGVALLGERMSLRLVLGIPLAILGLFMVVGIKWNQLGPEYKTGVFLGLVTALCYAAFTLTLRKVQSSDKPLSPIANLAVITIAGALMLGGVVWFSDESFIIPDTRSLFSLAGYGFFSQALGWMLITRALSRVRASLAGLLLLLQPALAFAWDMLFFHRETGFIGGAGIALTLFAIYLGTQSKTGKR